MIADAITSWKKQHTAEEITSVIHKKLDAHAEEVMLKMLGFNRDYRGRWEIDHCNGRAGNSPIGDFLKQVQQKAIQDWFSKAAMPTLTPTMQKTIQKVLNDEYVSALMQEAKNHARHQATNDLNALIEKLTAVNSLKAFMKVQELLNG